MAHAPRPDATVRFRTPNRPWALLAVIALFFLMTGRRSVTVTTPWIDLRSHFPTHSTAAAIGTHRHLLAREFGA